MAVFRSQEVTDGHCNARDVLKEMQMVPEVFLFLE